MAKTNAFKILILLFLVNCASAQIQKKSPLFITLKKQDSLFFERGFNQCDLEYLEKIVASDLKFYHDQSGFQNKKQFFKNTREYICPDSHKKPIRKLQKGSLAVFPLYNNGKLYGAIQKGVHNFYIREKDKGDVWTNTAKFTSVWTKNNEDWILNEVLSYDHQKPGTKNEQLSPLNQLLSDNNVPAMGIGVIENGKLTKVQVYGSLDGKETAPYNTIFKVASLTKPVFAFTVLQLIDKGLLDLDEPLYKYWIDPDIKNDERHKKLTPRIILSHQTGFPNWRYLEKAKKLEFQFDPGTKYQYSGEGFEYLRKAIENKFSKKIEEMTKELVFEPANMTDTRFWWDTTMDETRYAQNFDKNGNKIPTKKYYKANAAANLLTTVEDYGRFLEYVMNTTSLSENLFSEMTKQQVNLSDDNYFGLGWQILTNFSKKEYGLIHTGKDPGVSTLAIIFPKSGNGYLIFLNGDNVDAVYEEVLSKDFYLGQELWSKR